jgi:predicted HicB family RNase H-like nuclease
MLDLRNMRIISLGVPKAMKLEEFAKVYDINMDDGATNFIVNNVDGVENKVAKHRIYKFPEGTMITYNPALKKFNVDPLVSSDNHDDEEDDVEKETKETKENMEVIQENLDKQFNQLFQYSTRKVVGTGRFSSTKTFLEMFNENNAIANTNLENIPAEIMQDKVLVFNIEHPENRIISNQVRNFNTLCGVFQFKTEEQANQEYSTITGIEYNNGNLSAIQNGFVQLANNMVTQIHVSVFKKQVQELGVNLHMPEVIKSFERKNAEGVSESISESISTDELSLNQLVNIVNSKPKGFQGYIIYGINGERTKIMSTKYKELKILFLLS